MRVDASTQSNLSIRLPGRDLPPGLRLGSELAARVSRDPNGQWVLHLDDGTQLTADSTTPLRPGEVLALRVAGLKPTVVLQIIGRQNLASAIETALRDLLPRPESRQPLASSLLGLLGQDPQALPSAVRQALTLLLRALPRAGDLADAARLRSHLQSAGLLLESRLNARTGLPDLLQQDLKAALLRLSDAAQRAPRTTGAEPAAVNALSTLLEIAAQAERALNRIELLQLHAAQPGPLDLLIELPVLSPQQQWDQLQFRVQDDPEDNGQDQPSNGEPGLQMRLAFGFAGIGRLAVSIRLRGERIQVYWWSEQATLAATVREHLPLLEERLQALGLRVDALECVNARGPELDDLPLLQRRGIINERA